MTTYAEAGPLRRAVWHLVTQTPVARLSARFLPALDRTAVRWTGGTASGWVTGPPIVELTTTGARSGARRLAPRS